MPGFNIPATQAPGLGNASVFDLLMSEQTLLVFDDGGGNPTAKKYYIWLFLLEHLHLGLSEADAANIDGTKDLWLELYQATICLQKNTRLGCFPPYYSE